MLCFNDNWYDNKFLGKKWIKRSIYRENGGLKFYSINKKDNVFTAFIGGFEKNMLSQ